VNGAVQILLDLRDRWAERGVDWWSSEPTERAGDGWVRIDELAADPERIGALVTGWGSAHGIDARKAAASLFAKRLGSILSFPPTVAWMAWRRVPTVRPETTWLRFVDDEPVRLAVDEPQALVRADDPLVGAAGVDVADEAALVEHLRRTAYEATMGTLIDGVHAAERTGRRHLWGNLGLTAINSALWSAPVTEAWGDGRRLLQSDDRLARTIDVLEARRPDTGPFLVALRKTCCLAYADDDHGYCASCSLLDREDRIEDLTVRIGNAWRDRTG
jgi:hypothetical protein